MDWVLEQWRRKWLDRRTVKLHVLRGRDVAHLDQSRHDVDIRSDWFNVATASQLAVRPLDKEGDSMSPVVLAAFPSPHAGVEDVSAA